MRIIAKFNDYLDGCQSLGQDKSILWNRQQSEFPWRGSAFESVGHALQFSGGFSPKMKGVSLTFSKSCVYFAAKAYPFIRVSFSVYPNSQTYTPPMAPQHFYAADALSDYLEQVHGMFLDDIAYHRHDYSHLGKGKKAVRNWFTETGHVSQTLHSEILKARLACVLAPWSPADSGQSQSVCLIEPALKDIQFYRALPAAQAYQEMAMFLGGVLPAQSVMPILISDKDRVLQHGFNKYSFRKPKQA